MRAASPELSIVIATYNRPVAVRQVVEAVMHEPRVEVVVVDDGSRPPLGAADVAFARLVVHERNLGLAAARNTGLRESRGRLVCWLDDDTVPQSGFVAATLHFHERQPADQVGCVADIVWPKHPLRTRFETLMGPLASPTWDPTGFFTTPFQFYGATVTVKRRFLLAHDPPLLFDTRFRSWGCEDTEWAYRLKLAGARLTRLQGADVAVEHHTRLDLDAWIERTRRSAANVLAFAEKFPDDPFLVRWVGKGMALPNPQQQTTAWKALRQQWTMLDTAVEITNTVRTRFATWQAAVYSLALAEGLAPLLAKRSEWPASWVASCHRERLWSQLQAADAL